MGLQSADGGLQEKTLSKSQDSSITCLQLHLPAEQQCTIRCLSIHILLLMLKRLIFRLAFSLGLQCDSASLSESSF